MLDFEPWDQLLRRYVNDRGQVDYRRWQADATQLEAWLDRLSSVNPALLPLSHQLALWLNLYNALTIRQILQHYPLRSIRPTLWGVPNWLSFFLFFQRSSYRLNQESYSLNRIEHAVLRPQFQDPRIHFALVCASIGCPLLRNHAYDPTIVLDQLEDDARRFIRNPDKVRYDTATGILYCSKIFKWYQQDFLQKSPSIAHYIQPYLDVPLNLSAPVQYLPYDWHLNTVNVT